MNKYRFNFTVTDEDGIRKCTEIFEGSSLEAATKEFYSYKNKVYDYEIVELLSVESL